MSATSGSYRPAPDAHARVTAGRPTAEEAAAALLAVDRLRAETARGRRSAAWARAARLEGRGEQQLACPGDLLAQER